MKPKSFFMLLPLVAMLSLVACQPDNPPIGPTGPGSEDTTIVIVDTTKVDTAGWNIPAEALTVAQAREVCSKLASEATTGTKYYVKGKVKKLHSKHADGIANYGNASFYMVDNTGDSDDFLAYQVYGLDGKKITNADAVAVGDFVVVYGELTNYNGTYETVSKGAAYIWKSTNKNLSGGDTPSGGVDTTATVVTIQEALDLIGQMSAGAKSTEKYRVRAKVTKIYTSTSDVPGKYTDINMALEDETGSIGSYYTNYLNNTAFTSSAQIPAVGTELEVIAYLKSYVNTKTSTTTPELCDGWIHRIISSTEPEEPTGDVEGSGTEDDPYTATDVITLNNGTTGNYFVKAYIVGQVAGRSLSTAEFAAPFTPGTDSTTFGTNLLIAASATETNVNNCVPVALPKGAIRNALNLPENPTMLGKEVLIYGSLEKYFSVPGVKSPTYAKVGDQEWGTKPSQPSGDDILNETLLTQASYDKFTAVNVSGDQVWAYSTSGYGASMSGYDNSTKKTYANEDWFISPALDLSGKANVTLTFEHAFGPASAIPSAADANKQYSVWVSNDYTNDVASATWTQVTIPTYCTTAWSYVSSGEMAIPAANLQANCRIAWKYTCDNSSATWEIKNVVVR